LQGITTPKFTRMLQLVWL